MNKDDNDDFTSFIERQVNSLVNNVFSSFLGLPMYSGDVPVLFGRAGIISPGWPFYTVSPKSWSVADLLFPDFESCMIAEGCRLRGDGYRYFWTNPVWRLPFMFDYYGPNEPSNWVKPFRMEDSDRDIDDQNNFKHWESFSSITRQIKSNEDGTYTKTTCKTNTMPDGNTKIESKEEVYSEDGKLLRTNIDGGDSISNSVKPFEDSWNRENVEASFKLKEKHLRSQVEEGKRSLEQAYETAVRKLQNERNEIEKKLQSLDPKFASNSSTKDEDNHSWFWKRR